MLLHDKEMTAYFGDKRDDLKEAGAYVPAHFEQLSKKLSLEKMIFLKQTHSKEVIFVEHAPGKSLTLFETEGDALITQQKGVGLGVVTADCLPVLFYDAAHEAIGAVHAGWKGLALGILEETVSKMQAVFGTDPAFLKATLGPSSDDCCYEVQPDFLSHFSEDLIKMGAVLERSQKYFFKAKTYAMFALQKAGLLLKNSEIQHHTCTICNPDFCSFRRDGALSGRQPSVIFLR